jgi:transposase-like protein
LGGVEREGRARAIVVPDVKAKTLVSAIEANVIKDATVYTDDLMSYDRLATLGFD